MKKCSYQQNSRDVSCDSYISYLGKERVTDFRDGGGESF